MPRRSLLSATERESLLAIPSHHEELIRRYTLSESVLSLIRQHRGAANRLGFAIQLCYMRYPGIVLEPAKEPFASMLGVVAAQLKVAPGRWAEYGERDETRREHLLEIAAAFGFRPFTVQHDRATIDQLVDLGCQTDKGIVLAEAMIESLRKQHILLPSVAVIERTCAEAITRANRRIYAALTESFSQEHRQRLDQLLTIKDGRSTTWLVWLRQSPARPNSRSMLEHIDRLKAWETVDLPVGIDKRVHQNRMLKIAREGAPMTASDLAKFEPQRRYATLAALVIEGRATVIDEIIGLHDQVIGKIFQSAKNRHEQQFQESGKAINDKLRLYGRVGQALLEAKKTGSDAFAAIEAILPWNVFAASVSEAQKLAQPEDFDFLHRVGESHATLRRYAPAFLNALTFRAAPAARDLLAGVEALRGMYADKDRKVPADAPSAFIKKRWEKLVITGDGFDRRYYELCLLSELKNALRSGDIWVEGSRQFKDFEEYLLPSKTFDDLKNSNTLSLAVVTDCEPYLKQRTRLLDERLALCG